MTEASTDVIVVGGGLAGLAAATALAAAGFQVELIERRPFLGGRATSYEVPGAQETIDNCQHVLLGCCTNLLDFYRRIGAADRIRFYDSIPFVTPDGRVSVVRAGGGPAPLHLLASLRRFHALSAADKVSIAAGMTALAFELGMQPQESLDAETMLSWLRRHAQTRRAIDFFWRVVLTSALNEDLERVSAWHGLQVFWKGFLVHRDAYRVGVPAVPLGDLYRLEVAGVGARLRSAVRVLERRNGRIESVCLGDGRRLRARWFVVALPVDGARELLADAADYTAFEHSPITGIHLWFDRPLMDHPFAALLDRTMQWAFRKPDDECYVQCVVSASRALVSLGREQIIDLAVRELREFFPEHHAGVRKAAVVKELYATYSAAAGVDGSRPGVRTNIDNCFLAGDWTQTGWPPTMEGAVRSGYRAAERICAAAGRPRNFIQPDLQPEGFARWAPAARSRS